MLELSISLERSPSGFAVKNGSVAVVDSHSGLFYALAEERATGMKAAPGWQKSADVLLRSMGKSGRDVARVYVVGCGGTFDEYGDAALHEGTRELFPYAEMEIVGHHEAHAALAMSHSRAMEGRALVIDCGGDLLEPRHGNYWDCAREQTTLWEWRNGALKCTAQTMQRMWGLGEFYRAVTHVLGFGSQIWSCKVMALAAYESSLELSYESPFHFSNGMIDSSIGGSPHFPEHILRNWFAARGSSLGNELAISERIALARWAQRILTEAVLQLLKSRVAANGSLATAISGGVALNCSAARVWADSVAGSFCIPGAPGDTGIGLGALLARSKTARTIHTHKQWQLGPSRFPERINNIVSTVEALSRGDLIGLAVGGSELGPRALGHRSVLASPLNADACDRLRQFKCREWFQPFALSVLRHDAEELFLLRRDTDYGGMCIVANGQGASDGLVAGIHVDGTCRVQVLEEDDESPLADLLRGFRKQSGIGCLVHTSMNAPGMPIAETLSDVYRSARALRLDGLLVGSSADEPALLCAD